MKPITPLSFAAALILFSGAIYAGPYVPISGPISPNSPTFAPPLGPEVHPDKEYSHEQDRSSTHSGHVPDASQNTMWDGIGGIDDTFDYNNNDDPTGGQVDAIANHNDVLFMEVIANLNPILFSERSGPNTQGSGTDTSNPIYYETTGGAIDTWATWSQIDQNGGVNLDGLEVWGPEGLDDGDKYSLLGDATSGTSVYNFDGSAYISQSDILDLFDLTGVADKEWVDIDAMMINDAIGSTDTFDPGDWIMFSLWPSSLPGAPSAIGDAVWVWQSGGTVALLNHGGHEWYDGWNGVNIDALEAAAAPVPSALALMALGLCGLVGVSRRSRKAIGLKRSAP